MKKAILLLMGVIVSSGIMAQEISKNAIGVRLGDSDGFGLEANYQRAIGSNNNRLEFGLGVRDNRDFAAFKLAGLYEWVWNIDGGFNWYTGPGVGVGQVRAKDAKFINGRFEDDNETFAFAAGVVGIEYNFDFPLLISLDLRPELGFGDYRNDLDLDIAVSARYQF